MLKNIIKTLIILFSVSSVYASVRIDEKIDDIFSGTCGAFEIRIEGEIMDADVIATEKAIERINKNSKNRPCLNGQIVVWLQSDGGDPLAAIQLGRLMRKHEVHIVVRRGTKCSSACVFVFAGAVRRVAGDGQIGLHRPYFRQLDSSLTSEEIRKKRDSLQNQMKRYFEEIDVSPLLLEAMLGIPPEDIRYLSLRELNHYRLSFEDPTFNEREVAKDAFKYGLTSAEYRRRFAEVTNKCFHLVGSSSFGEESHQFCMLSTLLKISTSEAFRRYNLTLDKCWIKHQDKVDEVCRRRVYTTGQ